MPWIGDSAESGVTGFISNTTPTVLVTNSQGANKTIRIEKLLITNIDTSTAVTLEVYKVPSGGAISGDDYKVVKARSVRASDGNFGTEDIREVAGLILTNGDSLQALAGTASKLKFDISYWKES